MLRSHYLITKNTFWSKVTFYFALHEKQRTTLCFIFEENLSQSVTLFWLGGIRVCFAELDLR